MSAPRIVVVGSVNLDVVARCADLPRAGETVTGATLEHHPGGKGANQALAARRLGADVSLIARVGGDPNAEQALALLRRDGVDLTRCAAADAAPTGLALIVVAENGENQIVVAPGANMTLTPDCVEPFEADATICQMEIPSATVLDLARKASGLFCVNLAPARPVELSVLRRADLIVLNEGEAAWYGDSFDACDALVAVTYGGAGAELLRRGTRIARVAAPRVEVVDTTGAGDCFVAALTLALLEGRPHEEALRFACMAGALAVTRRGAQTSLPWRREVDDALRA